VPVVSCPRCGESYLTADTLHQIHLIRQQRAARAPQRPVAVARFVDGDKAA
jgi:hypothetical protein